MCQVSVFRTIKLSAYSIGCLRNAIPTVAIISMKEKTKRWRHTTAFPAWRYSPYSNIVINNICRFTSNVRNHTVSTGYREIKNLFNIFKSQEVFLNLFYYVDLGVASVTQLLQKS